MDVRGVAEGQEMLCGFVQSSGCAAVADPGGANPTMAPPFNLVTEFGPPLKKIKMVLKNDLNIHTLIMMINFTYIIQ